MNLVIQPEARALTARASGYRMDGETETFLVAQNGSDIQVSREPGTVSASYARQTSGDLLFQVASADRASDGHHGHSSPRGDGADNLLVADPISAHEGKTYTHEGANNFRTHNVVWDDRNHAASEGLHHTLRGAGLQRSDVMTTSAGVRRLTPLECERLMGWPDEHTRYAADGREISDSHRYRLCGNGVVAPVAEWLGHRLMAACQR